MDTSCKVLFVNLVFILTIQTVLTFAIESDVNNDHKNSYSEDSNSVSIENKLSWACANNASCINNLAKTISNNLKNNRAISFGFMEIESLNNFGNVNRKGIKFSAAQQARGISSNFLHFLDGHSIKVPIGPMVINIQGSDDYDNYLEVSLLKKSEYQVKSSFEVLKKCYLVQVYHLKKSVSFFVLFIPTGRRRHDKKQLQMYIPAFLAVNAVGWMLLAIAAVKVLTFKALLVSKAAFLIASMMTIKKMMESSSEKQIVMPPPMEHQHEYMMPYSMEYGGSHSFPGSEMNGVSEMTMAIPMHHSSGGMDMSAMHGMGSLGAESAINSVVDIHNVTQLAALQSSLAAQGKIKRNDMVWNGGARRQQNNYNYIMSQNPFIPSQKA